jgi:HSP20 family protein
MNNVTRWDPFRELNLWSDRMSRLLAPQPAARRESEESLVSGTWMPPVDIVESKDKITIHVELPGFKESQVDLTVEDGILTVKGERRFEAETSERNYHRVERSYGTFVRSFTLPTNVDQGRIEARFADGVLAIDMPKREETKPKQIRIQGGAPAKTDIDVKKTK